MVSSGDVDRLRKYRVYSSMDAAQKSTVSGVDDEFSNQALDPPRYHHRFQIVIWPKLPRKPIPSSRLNNQAAVVGLPVVFPTTKTLGKTRIMPTLTPWFNP